MINFRRFLLLSLLIFLTGEAINVQAETTYTHTFKSGELSNNSTPLTKVTLDNVTWNISYTKGGGNSYYFGTDKSKGIQLGSGNNPFTEYTLSTSAFSGSITSVTVNASMAKEAVATIAVTVGGTSYGSKSLTTTATDYTFTGRASGELKISLSQTTSKALYIKSITVTYGGSTTTKEDAGISFSATTATATLGKSFTPPHAQESQQSVGYLFFI